MEKVAPGKTRLGWIGTGVMRAEHRCGHLLAAGFSTTVFTRTAERAGPLLERGARWADSPRAVAQASDVVFSIVGHPADVRAVMLGPEGALAGSKKGNVLVDMTTSEPSLAEEIRPGSSGRRRGQHRCTGFGGDVGAAMTRLSIMIGGEAAVVEALSPCWQAMGKTIIHQGPAGAGQHTKLVNQILIATNMIGVCEALLYGYRAGLDLNVVMAVGRPRSRGKLVAIKSGATDHCRQFCSQGFWSSISSRTWALRLAEAKRLGAGSAWSGAAATAALFGTGCPRS